MVGYFRNVRLVSDRMLKAGNGQFTPVGVSAGGADAFGVRCGDRTWVYIYNPGPDTVTSFETDSQEGHRKVRALDFSRAVFRRQKSSVNIPPKGEALFEIK